MTTSDASSSTYDASSSPSSSSPFSSSCLPRPGRAPVLVSDWSAVECLRWWSIVGCQCVCRRCSAVAVDCPAAACRTPSAVSLSNPFRMWDFSLWNWSFWWCEPSISDASKHNADHPSRQSTVCSTSRWLVQRIVCRVLGLVWWARSSMSAADRRSCHRATVFRHACPWSRAPSNANGWGILWLSAEIRCTSCTNTIPDRKMCSWCDWPTFCCTKKDQINRTKLMIMMIPHKAFA